MIEYSKLGRSGLKVSRICLGTMNFGWRIKESDAFTMMDRARELGINYFDCADVYGNGYSETVIGKWFNQGNGRRESTIVTSKVFMDMNNPDEGPNGSNGLSAWKIKHHIDGTLSRMQTDHLDVYFMHHVDPTVTWDETWGAFEDIIHNGKVCYIGSSNFGARHLCYAQAAAEKRHFLGLITEQCQYNLLHRLPEIELIPAAQDLGIGIMPWSPLAGGMLSGHYKKGQSRGPVMRDASKPVPVTQLEAYSKLCRELGETEADVAIAWLLRNSGVTSIVIGPSSPDHLEQAIKASQIELPDDFCAELDNIFPGYEAGPEAYAW